MARTSEECWRGDDVNEQAGRMETKVESSRFQVEFAYAVCLLD